MRFDGCGKVVAYTRTSVIGLFGDGDGASTFDVVCLARIDIGSGERIGLVQSALEHIQKLGICVRSQQILVRMLGVLRITIEARLSEEVSSDDEMIIGRQ